MENHQLIQGCITHRGSTLAMLERLQEQEAPIAAVLVDDRSHCHLVPDVQEWVLIEELITILTNKLQKLCLALNPPPYQCYTPLIKLTHNKDSSDIHAMKEAASMNLRCRYSSLETQTFLDTATFLAPR